MYFSHLGVSLISVKPLTTENTENKTTPKICKITVFNILHGCVCVCVCVCLRERERRERDVMPGCGGVLPKLSLYIISRYLFLVAFSVFVLNSGSPALLERAVNKSHEQILKRA